MINPPYTFRALNKAEADDFEARHRLRHPGARIERRQDKVTVIPTTLIYGEPASPGDIPPIIDKIEGAPKIVDRFIVESDVKP